MSNRGRLLLALFKRYRDSDLGSCNQLVSFFFKEKKANVESGEAGKVRDLLCKNIPRKVHSAVRHLSSFGFSFFGQVQLGFSLVKSFAEDSVPCLISVCSGRGEAGKKRGLCALVPFGFLWLFVSPFLFLELPAGTPWSRCVSLKVFPLFSLHRFPFRTQAHRRRTSTF